MVHEDYKEMLAARALNALDHGDERDLAAHLQTCGECQSRLSEWEEVTATLSFAALETRPLEPSSQLRRRILETIRIDATARANAKGTANEDRARTSNAIARSKNPKWLIVPAWAALAAGLVFVVLSASMFVLWRQNRTANQELARLSDQIQDTQQQLDRQRQAIDIIAAPGMRMSELAGTKMMPGAHAMLAYDRNGRAILMAKGLPPPPAGKVYQLWFIAAGQPMPGKTFITDPSGAGTLNDQVPVEALNAPIFAITLEPTNGVPAPTGAIYLSSGS